MAELTVPYVRRQLVRRQGGGGGGGVPAQPRIPDVSGMYSQAAGVGEEITQAGGILARIEGQKQRARDTATLTALEASIDEQVAFKAQDILRDAAIHPFDYRTTLQAYRDELLQEAVGQVPDRIKPMAEAKVRASTTQYLIKIDSEGTKRGVDQALQTLDVRTDQLIRQQVAESDPNQRAMLDTEIRNLYGEYVQSGIITPVEATQRLQKVRDQSAIFQTQQAIRRDPDGAVSQLEQGLQANQGIPPEAYGKLVDEARRVQRERFEFAESRERAVERDTEREQRAKEAELFGQVALGKAGLSVLNQMRDRREIRPEGYEMLVRYVDTKAREDRAEARSRAAEARSRASHALAMEERSHRETEAQLSILASTGEIDEKGIIELARAKKLPARAMDQALAKAQARARAQDSEFSQRHNQAEQLLRAGLKTRSEFETLDPVSQQALSSSLDDLTRRSKAYGGQEDPLAVAQEILPRYQGMIGENTQIKAENLGKLLQYQTPEELEMHRGEMSPEAFRRQQEIFYQLEQFRLSQPPPPEPAKKAEQKSFWENFGLGSIGAGLGGIKSRIWGGGEQPEMSEFGRPKKP